MLPMTLEFVVPKNWATVIIIVIITMIGLFLWANPNHSVGRRSQTGAVVSSFCNISATAPNQNRSQSLRL